MAEYYYSSKDILDKAIGTDAYFQIKSILTSTKAADVAPVRHAKWEVVIGSDGKEHMVCTGCRKQQELTGVFTYCPNCGAKMDGDGDAD